MTAWRITRWVSLPSLAFLAWFVFKWRGIDKALENY